MLGIEDRSAGGRATEPGAVDVSDSDVCVGQITEQVRHDPVFSRKASATACFRDKDARRVH